MIYIKQTVKLLISIFMLVVIGFLNIFKQKKVNKNKLLIVKVDNIGDYVLFRNFLQSVRDSEVYKNYEITLCGNIAFKDFAEFFDSDYVDNFIWVDMKKFQKNIFYAFKLLLSISKQGFDTAVQPVLSRSWGDIIIAASSAKNRVSSIGNTHNILPFQKIIFDGFYTKLLKDKEEKVFEFTWNKNFFEVFLNTNLDNVTLYLETDKINSNFKIEKPYVVIFPGASCDKKCWDINKYCEVIEYILNNTEYLVVISGGAREQREEKMIKSYFGNKFSDRLLYFINKLSLVDLVSLIKNSTFLISNETVAPHIAAAVGTKFICISNGEAIGRFHPYPADVFNGGVYIYTPKVLKSLNKNNIREDVFGKKSFEDINLISKDYVILKLKTLLH